MKQTITKESNFPQLIISNNNPDEITGISFVDNGKAYYFSNQSGHKVMTLCGKDQRPMTKNEFKEIRAKMANCIISSDTLPERLVEEMEKLNFGLGHANGTFEVVTAHMSTSGISTLVINLGNARYMYNQATNTVFHIDHSKRIVGKFMQDGPEKTTIINKITSSKTMSKKLAAI